MPKMKSHSGAKKRFRATGTGRLKRRSATLNHILAKRDSKNKRQLGRTTYVDVADESRMKSLLKH